MRAIVSSSGGGAGRGCMGRRSPFVGSSCRGETNWAHDRSEPPSTLVSVCSASPKQRASPEPRIDSFVAEHDEPVASRLSERTRCEYVQTHVALGTGDKDGAGLMYSGPPLLMDVSLVEDVARARDDFDRAANLRVIDVDVSNVENSGQIMMRIEGMRNYLSDYQPTSPDSRARAARAGEGKFRRAKRALASTMTEPIV